MSLNQNINDYSKSQLEEENILLKQNLEDLNTQLSKVNLLLSNAEALKSHFISNITNEIVNPFTSIIGLAENLKFLKEGDIGQATKIGDLIYKEAFNLNYQLNNIFAAAKLEAGLYEVELVSCKLSQIINDVIETFKNEAIEKNIQVITAKMDVDLDLVVDKEKLYLILSNLLSNAVKYSHKEGKVTITIQNEEEAFKLIIKDEGIGIKSSKMEEIFDRFKQLDSEINTINKGYGLGLSVTKACIDIMEGSIEINSEEDKGSEFIITLPKHSKEEDMLMEDDFLFDEDGIF